MTIAVRNGEKCECCGEGKALDHKKTGAKAAQWRKAALVSQHWVAQKGLAVTQSFYSALELGNRHWTPALIDKFEKLIKPIMEQRRVDVGKL